MRACLSDYCLHAGSLVARIWLMAAAIARRIKTRTSGDTIAGEAALASGDMGAGGGDTVRCICVIIRYA
jgi:hypothetical protein